MKALIVTLSLVAINIELTKSQSMRQLPNIIINRNIPEAIIEAPRTFSPAFPQIDYKLIPAPKPAPPSTTIVTDCSPTVCKNLANTLQLMIVCNLLQNQKGGPDVALQLASPFLNEVISQPSPLSCGCQNQLFPNPIPSQPVITSNPPIVTNAYPNLIGQQLITGFPKASQSSACPNAGLLSLLGLFNS